MAKRKRLVPMQRLRAGFAISSRNLLRRDLASTRPQVFQLKQQVRMLFASLANANGVSGFYMLLVMTGILWLWLGGDKHQQIIKTLPKRGYLMDVAVPTTVAPVVPPLPLHDQPSVAVLPCTNMSGDPEQEYFADGITSR